ncbi:GroES-like protein [Glarea lozoyensis ATCC 20868]|uniref:GroES-like protein n=1 Tax=Glarea lozoyensis (strain ATCC 20868 / MF5171) TaxID=1116229 RepID=S3DU81_GLAL2|nr:GroES-like protein [Glarea lozoyensis ATCC 20868]EPE35516.1 GroES-like protein [Glarea lozoyensis ATCC 20868]
MSKNYAIVVQKRGEAAKEEVPIPKLRDDYILVKVVAVALNPTDWKHVDFLTSKGCHIGCDYAGTVEEVGSKVTKDFKKGDRIAGFAHGGNEVYHEDGAFANYITVKGDVQIKIPENLSFEEAATLGVGITTVGQGLYQSLGLPRVSSPSKNNESILIYGGSSATGSLAIQYAKLSGFKVLTTCSPHNFDYVKSLGADEVFDYNSPTCSSDIQKSTSNNLTHAFDCISEGSSPKISVSALATDKSSTYSTLLPVPAGQVKKINDKVTMKSTLGYTIFGEDFKFGEMKFPAKKEDFEFGQGFWEEARGLLEQGRVKVHKPSVNKHGKSFEGVLKGMDAMRQGKVSGEKLVFTI